MNNGLNLIEENRYDIKKIILKALGFRYLFLISLIVSLAFALMKNYLAILMGQLLL